MMRDRQALPLRSHLHLRHPTPILPLLGNLIKSPTLRLCLAQAHAAAAASSSSCVDAASAAGAYASALRALGLCVHARSSASAPHSPAPPQHPDNTRVKKALTDSMATFWVVNERELLWRVDQPRPGMFIDTADGTVAVEAIGTPP